MTNNIKKIQIIDDEPSIKRFLKLNLESEGYSVVESSSIKDAQEIFSRTNPGLIILDLGLPDGDGKIVLDFVKSKSNTPVIVLSVKASDRDKIRLLDGGADDYVAKPFSIDELLARVRVILRRSDSSVQPKKIVLGHVVIDGNTRETFIMNELIHLTATEFDLLYHLAANADRVITHDQLLKMVWGNSASKSAHYLRVYIAQIRKKLKNSATIRNESGVGYRLVAGEGFEPPTRGL